VTASEDPKPAFRLAYVPGVIPAKWVRIWNERLPDIPLVLHSVPAAEAAGLLRAGGADAAFVRLPVERDGLHAIPLYTEATVVLVPKDHLFTAADEELTAEDLAEELVLHPLDDTLDWAGAGAGHPPGLPAKERPVTTADAVELVAAGVGILLVPQSLARLHHRKDLTYRPLTEDAAPASRVALAWPEDATTDQVEDFIGIVRGRTVNSSRGRTPTPPQEKKPKTAKSGTKPGPKPGAKSSGAKSGSGKPQRRNSAATPKGRPTKQGRPRRRS
jgi:DNA-binding transcriptional LysR family regulator